jgi:hypothetical protein
MGGIELSAEDKSQYLMQIFSIVESYYLQKLLDSTTCLREKDTTHIQEKHKIAKKVKVEKKSSNVGVVGKKEAQELVSEYIDFKKSEQGFLKKDSATIENTFDILLLEFCQNGSEKILNQLHGHINSNPELYHYAISSILESRESSVLAHEVFMYAPSLLNKFFTLKKQLCDSSLQQKKASIIPKGVYEVQSNLKNTVYVSISSDLKKQLEEQNHGIVNKFTQKLLDCRFIKSDSKGISGIKTYKGLIKLKIVGEDISLATNKKYLDKSTGNILIIFDKVHTHKDKAGNAIMTHEVGAFDELWPLVGVLGAENQEGIGDVLDQGVMSFDHSLEEQSSEIIGQDLLG